MTTFDQNQDPFWNFEIDHSSRQRLGLTKHWPHLTKIRILFETRGTFPHLTKIRNLSLISPVATVCPIWGLFRKKSYDKENDVFFNLEPFVKTFFLSTQFFRVKTGKNSNGQGQPLSPTPLLYKSLKTLLAWFEHFLARPENFLAGPDISGPARTFFGQTQTFFGPARKFSGRPGLYRPGPVWTFKSSLQEQQEQELDPEWGFVYK